MSKIKETSTNFENKTTLSEECSQIYPDFVTFNIFPLVEFSFSLIVRYI
jgi:hypothetical protein